MNSSEDEDMILHLSWRILWNYRSCKQSLDRDDWKTSRWGKLDNCMEISLQVHNELIESRKAGLSDVWDIIVYTNKIIVIDKMLWISFFTYAFTHVPCFFYGVTLITWLKFHPLSSKPHDCWWILPLNKHSGLKVCLVVLLIFNEDKIYTNRKLRFCLVYYQ